MSVRTLALVPLLASIALTGCNDPPGGLQVMLQPEAPRTADGIDLVLSAPATDEQGHDITYEIVWSVNGLPQAELDGMERVEAVRTQKNQVWSVTVTPMDEKEERGEAATAEVTVINTAPELSGLSLTPLDPHTDDDLSVRVDEVDADGDDVTLSYAWTVDGAPAGSDSPTLEASAHAKGQEVVVTITADDGEETTSLGSSPVVVLNTPPVLDTARVTPDDGGADATFSCTPGASADLDGDAVSFAYAWLVSDVLMDETGATLTGGVAKGDTVACVVTPMDDEADGAPVTSNSVTVQNTVPALTEVALTGPPRTTDDVVATVSGASDLDADPVTYAFTWTVDGREVATTRGSDPTATLSADYFAKGQLIEVSVVGEDGEGQSMPVVASTRVANTPPVVSSLSLSPTTAYTTTPVSASATATDVDGDTLSFTYAWYVNKTKQSTTGSTLASSAFSKGDIVEVDATALDGDDASTPLRSSTLSISNSTPTAPSITLTPSSPGPSDDLVCTVSTASTDADGDALTYTTSWYRGSSLVSTSTSSAASTKLSASSTSSGETWSCRVFATDTDGARSPLDISSSVTIRSSWSGPRVFTSCGTTGRAGPTSSACSTAYKGKTLDGEVTLSGGIQTWTVPTTGTYRISAWGAQGGGPRGGKGAYIRGDFSLTAGTKLQILVGQRGGRTSQGDYCAGGGGGTYVYTSATASTPMLAAGGGGGQYQMGPGGIGSHTAATTKPVSSGTGVGAGGTSGNGGAGGSNLHSYSTAGGGSGWLSNGKDGLTIRNAKGIGGLAPRNGGTGGLYTHRSYTGAHGGFGGGGSASDNSGAGGGGGGYNGGGGANNYKGSGHWDGGGGAGSYNGGSSTTGSSGNRSGEGQVTIDLL